MCLTAWMPTHVEAIGEHLQRLHRPRSRVYYAYVPNLVFGEPCAGGLGGDSGGGGGGAPIDAKSRRPSWLVLIQLPFHSGDLATFTQQRRSRLFRLRAKFLSSAAIARRCRLSQTPGTHFLIDQCTCIHCHSLCVGKPFLHFVCRIINVRLLQVIPKVTQFNSSTKWTNILLANITSHDNLDNSAKNSWQATRKENPSEPAARDKPKLLLTYSS